MGGLCIVVSGFLGMYIGALLGVPGIIIGLIVGLFIGVQFWREFATDDQISELENQIDEQGLRYEEE